MPGGRGAGVLQVAREVARPPKERLEGGVSRMSVFGRHCGAWKYSKKTKEGPPGVFWALFLGCLCHVKALGCHQPSFEPLPSFQGLRKTRRLLQPPRKPNVTLQRGLAFYFSVAFLTLPVLCSVNTAVWPRHALKNVTRIDVDVFQIAGQNTSAVASPCF